MNSIIFNLLVMLLTISQSGAKDIKNENLEQSDTTDRGIKYPVEGGYMKDGKFKKYKPGEYKDHGHGHGHGNGKDDKYHYSGSGYMQQAVGLMNQFMNPHPNICKGHRRCRAPEHQRPALMMPYGQTVPIPYGSPNQHQTMPIPYGSPNQHQTMPIPYGAVPPPTYQQQLNPNYQPYGTPGQYSNSGSPYGSAYASSYGSAPYGYPLGMRNIETDGDGGNDVKSPKKSDNNESKKN